MRRPRRSLTLIAGPVSEPVTLADAKTWARIDDDSSDTLISQLITSARMAAEEYLRRALMTQTHKLTLDLCGSPLGMNWNEGVYDLPVTALYGGLPQTIELPKGPVQSINSVTTYDLNDIPSLYGGGNYHIDAAGERLVLNYAALWPASLRPVAACEVTYVAGYGDAAAVPQPVKTGILIHVASIYEQRGNCDDAMALPPGTAQLYNQYRIMGDRLG
ncbi:head-tail connector protein [Zavarzinella formosa]|uniref:head-tail connector protein n=1 Tax=Zavarzinella formosa TaxID=360055 RepID=UPI0002EB75EA|nr:phage head-tail connector protein [Zavarzinella formosa]